MFNWDSLVLVIGFFVVTAYIVERGVREFEKDRLNRTSESEFKKAIAKLDARVSDLERLRDEKEGDSND